MLSEKRRAGYLCRLPGETVVRYSFVEKKENRIPPLFIIAPFDTDLYPIIRISARDEKAAAPERLQKCLEEEGISDALLLQYAGAAPEDEDSAAVESRLNHRKEVEHFIGILKENASASGEASGKIVASRRKFLKNEFSPILTFLQLCEKHPYANVFMFMTPETGLWIGASPETLLTGREDEFISMALAGTRRTDTVQSGQCGWDTKNIHEQALVTSYICQCLERHGLKPQVSERGEREAGKVVHLCTPITASVPRGAWDIDMTVSLLLDLSPTPALCGSDKESAKAEIKEAEGETREYYGGFCGIIRSATDFHIWVNLRSARIYNNLARLHAGGGITADSDPEAEWEETEVKLTTLAESLVPYSKG